MVAILLTFAWLLPGECVRGRSFHNCLVEGAATTLGAAGFAVAAEWPLRLADGRTDFVDLLATRGPVSMACEIETTPRNAAANARKAIGLGLPLLIIVPDRGVRDAVICRLGRVVSGAEQGRVFILLPGQLSQGLTNCLSPFSLANAIRKNGKTRRGSRKDKGG